MRHLSVLRMGVPLLITLPGLTCAEDADASPQVEPPSAPVTVTVIAPLLGPEMATFKLPYFIQSADAEALSRSHSLGLADFMNSQLAGVTLNHAQNNPLQPDLQYRGFTATPLLGGSEGLSVHVDGVRVNEVFGDTVNWDLIPDAAIARVDLLSGANPVFGLNTLGGALALQTKTGFSQPGTRAQYYTGDFGRQETTRETGGHAGEWGWYLMGRNFDEDGWRDLSPSRAANLYGTLSWHREDAQLDLHAGRGNSKLVGNGAAPIETSRCGELLQTDANAIRARRIHRDRQRPLQRVDETRDVPHLENPTDPLSRQRRINDFDLHARVPVQPPPAPPTSPHEPADPRARR